MEIRVIWRGALSGFVAGVLAFVFAKIFAEPTIDRSIDYESGRGEVIDALNKAAGRTVAPEGPEIFSRHIQSTIGIFSGIVAFATAMGALIGVAYVILQGRVPLRLRPLAMSIAVFGFFAVFLLPFVKYPANPPAIGHEFTIAARGHLYLIMVGVSLVLLGAAVWTAYHLRERVGALYASLIGGVGFLVLFGVVIALLPSLGDLSANVDVTDQFGYARSATETPAPITNILSRPLTVDGRTIAPGQLVYPGFPADTLWKFRWYSIIDQLIIWLGAGLFTGELLDRFFRRRAVAAGPADEPRPLAETTLV